MKLSLIVVSPGKMNRWTIAVKRPCFVIGRQADCQLRPTSDMVSKRHCVIFTGEDAAFVDDLGSTNGTFLNDQPVRDKTELHDQDALRVGPLLFTVRLEPGSFDLPPQEEQASPGMAEEELAATLLMSIPDKPTRRFPAALQKDAAPQRAKPSKPDLGGTARVAKAILRKLQHPKGSTSR